MFWILTPISPPPPPNPFSWVSKSFRQDIGRFHSPWIKSCQSADHSIKVNIHIVVDMKQGESKFSQNFNLESFYYQKTFFMKNLTDLRKTVETGVDPHLRWVG